MTARATPPRTVAVIAHTGKTLGGGFDELRSLLSTEQIQTLYWYEVPKSRKAPKQLRKALAKKPDLIIVWGGDGMLQRCSDAAAGHDVPIAVMPAGTANLLATNLGVPIDLSRAVDIAFRGAHRTIDLGWMNGEHFAVMAGAGFDAEMINRADGNAKSRLGRLAYIWAGAQELTARRVRAKIRVDGRPWFKGDVACVLIGNVPKVFANVTVFDDARPDDGRLDVGVATASNAYQLGHSLARIATGRSDAAPHVHVTQARKVSIRTSRPVRYEMDGGARGRTRHIKLRVAPSALTMCVPGQ